MLNSIGLFHVREKVVDPTNAEGLLIEQATFQPCAFSHV